MNTQTFASVRLYLKAKELLGQKLVKGDPTLGCVYAINEVFRQCFGYPLSPDGSTFTAYTVLSNNADYLKVKKPLAGDIILSPTGYGNGNISNGHIGIIAAGHGILSNDSATGYWREKWTLETWEKHYGEKGGFPVLFYRIQDNVSSDVVQKKLSLIRRMLELISKIVQKIYGK